MRGRCSKCAIAACIVVAFCCVHATTAYLVGLEVELKVTPQPALHDWRYGDSLVLVGCNVADTDGVTEKVEFSLTGEEKGKVEVVTRAVETNVLPYLIKGISIALKTWKQNLFTLSKPEHQDVSLSLTPDVCYFTKGAEYDEVSRRIKQTVMKSSLVLNVQTNVDVPFTLFRSLQNYRQFLSKPNNQFLFTNNFVGGTISQVWDHKDKYETTVAELTEKMHLNENQRMILNTVAFLCLENFARKPEVMKLDEQKAVYQAVIDHPNGKTFADISSAKTEIAALDRKIFHRYGKPNHPNLPKLGIGSNRNKNDCGPPTMPALKELLQRLQCKAMLRTDRETEVYSSSTGDNTKLLPCKTVASSSIATQEVGEKQLQPSVGQLGFVMESRKRKTPVNQAIKQAIELTKSKDRTQSDPFAEGLQIANKLRAILTTAWEEQ